MPCITTNSKAIMVAANHIIHNAAGAKPGDTSDIIPENPGYTIVANRAAKAHTATSMVTANNI